MRLRAQEVDGSGHIPEHLLVWDAAALADFGDHRLVGAVADPEIEAGRDRGIAVMGKFAGDFAGPLIPARHVVDNDDSGMRTGIGRVCVVCVTAVAAMAAIGRHSRLYVAKRHVDPLPPNSRRLSCHRTPAKASRISVISPVSTAS